MVPHAGESSSWLDAEVERLAAAWKRGGRPAAGDVPARHPGRAAGGAAGLISGGVCPGGGAGQEVMTPGVVRRYPRWRDELEPLLGFDRLIRPRPPDAAEFPEVGETLGDFCLLAE